MESTENRKEVKKDEETEKKKKELMKKVDVKKECHICKKMFAVNFTLKRHMKVAHPDPPDLSHSIFEEEQQVKPFSCSECGQGFTRMESKLRHIRRVHPIDISQYLECCLGGGEDLEPSSAPAAPSQMDNSFPKILLKKIKDLEPSSAPAAPSQMDNSFPKIYLKKIKFNM